MKKLGSQIASVTLPVVYLEAGHIILVPKKVLDRRLIKRKGRPVTQLLVKWLNAAVEDNMWEDFITCSHQFPQFYP